MTSGFVLDKVNGNIASFDDRVVAVRHQHCNAKPKLFLVMLKGLG
jgi:hypothetical protein